MKLESLQIDQVRNLKSLTLVPCPQINLITGKNASGKTSILEAIYLLARGRSFRTPRIQEVIQHKTKNLTVIGKINNEAGGTVFTGIEKEYGQQTIKYNGDRVKTISEQARNVPLVLITQDSHLLVTGSGKQRRHWLDWAMFHVEPDYLDNWKNYVKALRQRNALLKKQVKNRDLYRSWEDAMVESGSYLYQTRERFIGQLEDAVDHVLEDVFVEKTNLKHIRGWPEKKELAHALTESWETDLKIGYTRPGPHQADIKIINSNKDISAVFSRGQIKLFVCFLMLAQARVFAETNGTRPLVLFDDFSSELDVIASERLLRVLLQEGFQSFLTTAVFSGFPVSVQDYRMFHVERGAITSVENQFTD